MVEKESAAVRRGFSGKSRKRLSQENRVRRNCLAQEREYANNCFETREIAGGGGDCAKADKEKSDSSPINRNYIVEHLYRSAGGSGHERKLFLQLQPGAGHVR